MGKVRGQSSIELVSILGLFMLAVSASLIYFYPEWETANRLSMAEATMKDIRMTVDGVYSSGPGRRETITVRVPTGVIRTQASDGLMNMVLDLPGGGFTEVLEVTDAPLKGSIPLVDGVHQISVEYTRSGYVVLGSGLVLAPSHMVVETTSANLTRIVVNVTDAGDTDLSDVRLSAGESTPVEFAFNESVVDLSLGETKVIQVSVRTPNGIIPGRYTDHIRAEGGGLFAEAQVDVSVGGVVCGDGVKDPSEECETTTLSFPEPLSEYCPNPSGGVLCDAAGSRYKAVPPFGDCVVGCRCQPASEIWISCGSGCRDPNYCNNCAHCFDNVINCGETVIDGGGACPICDGVDDAAEGFPCTMGETQPCGLSDCAGTRNCVADGPSCGWGRCTSYGMKCPANKCCSCMGASSNPQPLYNDTFNTDCTPFADQTACGNPGLCQGGFYRGECSGLDSCSPDFDQSTWNMSVDVSACAGQSCRESSDTCYDGIYPCHGRTTSYACDASVDCSQSTAEDASACGDCPPPPWIVLHRMEGSQIYDYAEANASWGFGPGWVGEPWWQCAESRFSYTELTIMEHTEVGAYAPYQNGTLKVYGKAWHIWNQFHHDSCHWSNCAGAGKGSFLRIGTDRNNYLEYNAPTPDPNWRQYSVNLRNPTRRVGAVDWDNIRYLDFSYIVGLECQPSDTGCGSCNGWLDYVTLTK
ncbi:MAG: hypothetical protein V1875_01455 [Candidatus Altiarchaeota archaeon]